MAWIPFYQELANHPKTHKLARLTGLHPREIIGMLASLWWYCLDYAPDGDITDLDREELARASLWETRDGSAEVWIDALIQCGRRGGDGYIDAPEQHDGRLILHDWGDFTGRYVLHRQEERQRQRRIRASKRASLEGGKKGDLPGRSETVLRTNSVPFESQYRTGQNRTEDDTPLQGHEMFYDDGRPIDLDWVASIMDRFQQAYPAAKCSYPFLVRTIGHYDRFPQRQVDYIVDQFCDNYDPKKVKNAVQAFAGWLERRTPEPLPPTPDLLTATGNSPYDAMVQQMATMGTRPASVSSDVQRMEPISLDDQTLVLATPLPVEYVQRTIGPQVMEALNNVGWGHLAVEFVHRAGDA